MVNAPVLVLAATLRFFGSAGAESQLTPANTASPLNPRNVANIPYQTNLADVSAFGEASSERWKVHVKLRADASDRGADRVRAGEAYVQLHANKWLELTAGRVIEKWGTGYGWNPTSFVGPPKNPTDPNDRRSSNRGVDMIRADIFVKETNVSLYALDGGDYAARVYRLIRGTDVSLVWRSRGAAGSQPAGQSIGINVSRVFGDALELHAEATRRHALAGGQYTFANDVNVVFELYYSGDGLTASEWDAVRRLDLAEANRAYAPLRMARTYAFARVYRPFPDAKIDAELIAIANLRDGSAIVRASLTRKLRGNLSAYLIETEFLGGAGSEMAYLQVKRVTTAGVRLYF